MAILLAACEGRKEMADGLERIPVNVEDVAEDAGAFLEKIEIVPLETNDSILFDTPSQIFYDKEADMYVLMSDMNDLHRRRKIHRQFGEEARAGAGRIHVAHGHQVQSFPRWH